ncbi:MAG TPA: deaminase, partial [Acidimicrobiales bacterium]|nr:deaminase [Acidimicrobiales bacterium]
MDDDSGMRRAIAVAATARRVAHPNPWVGAVLVPGDHEGSTAAPGGPHAEAAVLAAAGDAARGATMYVTLEPCCGFEGKRTLPCADAIVDAGIRRVVLGLPDPDRRVTGQGIARLREA